MGLTGREQQVWDEINQWEQRLQIGMVTDFTNVYDHWVEKTIGELPEKMKETFFLKLDNWLFHLHAIIQNSSANHDARNQILRSARIFNEQIQHIEDIQQLSVDKLTYLADSHIAKHRLASIVQGSLTGTGNALFLSTDLLGITIINLRVIQLIAMSFGFENRSPFEMMLSLKIFYTATLPKRFQQYAWEMMVDELNGTKSAYFYEGSEKITDVKWMEQPLKQIAKSLFLFMARKKVLHQIPVLGIAVGAGMNYKLTRQVTEFAEKFYQKRLLLMKLEDEL